MAEYFHAPARRVIKLPEASSHEIGVLAEPLAVAVHAVNKAGVQPGEKVAVLGSGTIGLLTLAVAYERGAKDLAVTDVMDYPLYKSQQLGATFTLNVTKSSNWTKAITDKFDGPCDKVFITNNSENIINEAINITKKAGKIVTIAMFQNMQNVNIPILQNTEKEIVGSMTYNHEDFLEAIRFIKEDHIPIKNIISHIFPYQKAPYAFQLVDKKEDDSLKVLLQF